jgi:hypothetical protein
MFKINQFLRKSLLENNIDLVEDYPASFNMEEFKKLTSFNKRIQYCQQHLKRISSGSSRIVYMIDDEKVLKLAKNKKGLAQNEIEAEYSNYNDLDEIVAKVFDYHNDNLWIEMELARKFKKSDCEKLTGYSLHNFTNAIIRYGNDMNPRKNPRKGDIDKELYQSMWDESEFMYELFSFIGNYDIPIGDLLRTSSYGVVKRNGQDTLVLIDYGLTHDVYDSYYS